MPYKNKEDAAAFMRRWRATNPEKVKKHRKRQSESAKAHYEANKEKHRERKRRYRYGISKEQFDELLNAQSSSCAICQTATPGGHGEFHVDHCHSTGAVRGLLCHHCNLGLGMFRDNCLFLQNAIGYLNVT